MSRACVPAAFQSALPPEAACDAFGLRVSEPRWFCQDGCAHPPKKLYNVLAMKKTLLFAAAGLCLVAAFSATRPRAEADPSAAWNRKAAAAYLDQRATWWTTWPNAQRDHQTFCISCHTALPYALARPALRQPLGETTASAGEAALLANITKRVTMWREVEPFYPDQTRGVPKTSESRATEAILNAVILARRDARTGSLSDEGRRALDNMWALQMKTGAQTGAWTWLAVPQRTVGRGQLSIPWRDPGRSGGARGAWRLRREPGKPRPRRRAS